MKNEEPGTVPTPDKFYFVTKAANPLKSTVLTDQGVVNSVTLIFEVIEGNGEGSVAVNTQQVVIALSVPQGAYEAIKDLLIPYNEMQD